MTELTAQQIAQIRTLYTAALERQQAKAWAEARQLYQMLRGLAPQAVEIHNNLGLVQLELNQPEDAAESFRTAVALQPQDPVPLFNLGNALTDAEDYDGAFAAYRRALILKPDFAEALNNMGSALMLAFQFPEAEQALRQAAALRPDRAKTQVNLADSLWAQGQLEAALETYRHALALEPDNPDAHMHYALALLRLGRLREGWAEQEWRWRSPAHIPAQRVHLEPWTGQPLAGKTLLLHGEQGFGDDLQFLRFVPRLQALGAQVILRLDPSLLRLVTDFQTVSSRDPVPEADYALSLLSLPHRLGLDLADIGIAAPYLTADPALLRKWKNRTAHLTGFRVGLVWSGDPRIGSPQCTLLDRRRSFDLEVFAPLAQVPGVRFISLQKGLRAAQAVVPPAGMELFDVMAEAEDFADTAALIESLDLVISVDTSVVHLAGALGKPVWILSRTDGCWRWGLEGETTPWYPSARIFRQSRRSDWAEVIGRVSAALRECAGPCG